jgi:drug/metabolite transporter (DMT)-like permease
MEPHRFPVRVPTATPRAAEIGLLVIVVIWGVNFSVIKVGLAALDPHAFNALRYPMAAALLTAGLAATGRLGLPERADLPRIVGLGILGHVIYQLLFIHGMDRTRAGNASLLLATAPIYTAILSGVLDHDRIGRRGWAAIAAAFAGMALVVGGGPGGPSFASGTVAGDLLILVAASMWALYTVGARDMVRKYGSLRVTTWVLWLGAVVLFLLGLPDLAAAGRVPAAAWGAVAYSGLLGIAVAQFLWYRAVRLIGSTHTSTFQNLVPVVAIVVAWVWLGEVPTAGQAAGAAIIIGAVSVVRRSVRALA